MAKNFPYFKFLPSEWLTGNIAFESLEVQGLFINICALYWQRDGNLAKSELIRRYKYENLIETLIEESYIEIEEEDNISIAFLDEQLIAANHISKRNAENGKKGGRPKASETLEEKPTGLIPLSEKKQIKVKESKEKETLPKVETFDFDKFLIFMRTSFKRDFRVINESVKKSIKARLKEGYVKADFINCVNNLMNNQYHKENGYQYCTAEFISRASTLEKYSSKSAVKTSSTTTPSTANQSTLTLG